MMYINKISLKILGSKHLLLASCICALIFTVATVAYSSDVNTRQREQAVFAGGCFWCVEKAFDSLVGVLDTTVGFTDGDVANPSYRQVVAGGTGHIEAVQVIYDPEQVSYQELLDVFWVNVDPLDSGGQFCDRGYSYTTGIFYTNPQQKEQAEQSKANIAQHLDATIATPIKPLQSFYPAEEYHQQYYKKNPIRYRFYRYNCGRDRRLQMLWG